MINGRLYDLSMNCQINTHFQVHAQIKRRALERPTEDSGTIITAVTGHLDDVVGGALPSQKTMRRLVDKTKASQYPTYKKPNSRREILFTPELTMLRTGTQFLLHDSGPETGDDRYFLFATRDFIARLGSSNEWCQVHYNLHIIH